MRQQDTPTADFVFALKAQDGSYKRVFVADVPVSEDWDKRDKPLSLPEKVKNSLSEGYKISHYRNINRKGKKGGAAKKPRKKAQKGKDAKKRKGQNRISPKKFSSVSKYKAEAQEIADLLGKLLPGSSHRSKTKARYNVDAVGLAMSYDKGENPLHYLSRPIEEIRKPKVLLTPDYSGSCNADMWLFDAVSKALADNGSIEVHYVQNANGNLQEELETVEGIDFDVILYVGDHDFFYHDEKNRPSDHVGSLQSKLTIVTSNFACNHGKPIVENKKKGFVTISRVSYSDESDIIQALRLINNKKRR